MPAQPPLSASLFASIGKNTSFDLVELKNLQIIVLDLAELKQLLLITKRPRVRSILSREIGSLESKVVSNSADSGEKASEEEDRGSQKDCWHHRLNEISTRPCGK